MLLMLCVELLCPKNRRLEVTTSRVERVGLVVTRQVRRHGLLLLVGRGDRQRRKVGSSLRHSRVLLVKTFSLYRDLLPRRGNRSRGRSHTLLHRV